MGAKIDYCQVLSPIQTRIAGFFMLARRHLWFVEAGLTLENSGEHLTGRGRIRFEGGAM